MSAKCAAKIQFMSLSLERYDLQLLELIRTDMIVRKQRQAFIQNTNVSALLRLNVFVLFNLNNIFISDYCQGWIGFTIL